MTFSELRIEMRQFNAKHGIYRKCDIKRNSKNEVIQLIAKIIFKDEVFEEHYSQIDRTYTIGNYNKAFCINDIGYSIFAYGESQNDCTRVEFFNNDDFESIEIISITE